MASNHLKNGMKDLQSYFPPNNNWSKKQMYNKFSICIILILSIQLYGEMI